MNEYLLSLGYESFLPLKSEFKIWRNRQRKLIKSPLFPSYIFVLATRNDIFDINRIYGICYCVTCAGVPAVISGNDIMSLKVGSINSIFYFLHKAAEPFNCLEQDNLA